MTHQGGTSGRVLVVGGGIAGFAMMRALGQRGISAVLVDRLSGPPDAGLGLNLPGNAVRALGELGVGEELKARGVPVRRREYRNDQARGLSRRGLLELMDRTRGNVLFDSSRWGAGIRLRVTHKRQVGGH
jgi:2-polyprenyl-6-methoxyphenol hydroxylase-like FAD-dependent oxidoreductase